VAAYIHWQNLVQASRLVESLEYILAFAISSGLAASGFILLQGYFPLVSQMSTRSEFSQIADAAELALVDNTNRTVIVNLNSASISCTGNLLYISSQVASYSAALNGTCSFSAHGLIGQHRLTFAPRYGSLSMRVDS